MKLVLAGGTEQLGNLLARAFTADGHAVVVLGRNPQPQPWRTVSWDAGRSLRAARRLGA